MPPTLSYPGVYIVEKASGVRTITGVATSVTAFLGRASKGPIDKPVRCLGPADFIRTFGPPHPESELAASVALFFANGGTDCWVVRLAKNAARSSATLLNYSGVNALIARAREAGRWGNSLRLEVDYNTANPEESFNLRVIYTDDAGQFTTELHTGLVMDPESPRFAPTFVTDSSSLITFAVDTTAAGLGDPTAPASFYNTIGNSFPGFSQARRGLGAAVGAAGTTIKALVDGGASGFEISVDGSSFLPVTIPVYAAAPGTAAQITGPIETAINTELNLNTDAPHPQVIVTLVAVAGVGRVLNIAAANGRQSSVRVRRAGSKDITAALMLGLEQGGIEPTRWSNFRPAATGSVLRLVDNAGSVVALDALADINQNAMANFTIDGTPVPVNVAPNSIVTTAGTDSWFKNAPPGVPANANFDGVREKLKIIANAVNSDNSLPYRAEQYGYTLVLLPKTGDLNTRPALAGGDPAFTGEFVVNVRQYPLSDAGPAAPLFSIGTLGSDGTAPDMNAYLGNPVTHTGIRALDTVDLFNLMVLPADAAVSANTRMDVIGPASNYCESRRAFLLIDAPDDWTTAGLPSVIQNQNKIDDLRGRVSKKYSAVFYPKVKYRDGPKVKDIGATGALAGLFARTDAARGVWKAPAGTEADLRNINGLSLTLTDLENGVLNKLGVNCIRSFPVGMVNWGSRTMDGSDDFGSEWKYIPIRRLALFLEETLYRSTKWVVFEPNDEPLWANIRLNIGAFMNSLFRQGAFQGSTPDKAFYVKCDGETTTQNDRNLGIVNIEVGFAPLKPAEFVVITIQQMPGDLE